MQRKALIFDDDEDILSMCSYVISSLGWEVHTRSACDDLFATLNTIKPSIIFMDNNIRNLDGIAATKMIKSHDDFKSIPVVYFSANPEIKELSRDAGADTYLEKPFNIKDLEKIINLMCPIPTNSETP